MRATHIPQWTWGDRLRKVRRESHLSQVEFADALGVTRQALGQWEAGNHEPRELVSVARRIQGEFGVPAEWMLGLMDTAEPTAPVVVLDDMRARRDSNSQPSDPKRGTSRLRVIGGPGRGELDDMRAAA